MKHFIPAWIPAWDRFVDSETGKKMLAENKGANAVLIMCAFSCGFRMANGREPESDFASWEKERPTANIDWNETRACKACGPKQRMILMHVRNMHAEDKFEDAQSHPVGNVIIRPKGAAIVKVFGCTKCGLKMGNQGNLP